MSQPILSIKQLTVTPKQDSTRHLVNAVSLTVDAGKTTCVVGESGSGKSLTALSVMGLLSPQLTIQQGACQFLQQDGTVVDLLNIDQAHIRKLRGAQMGMIFQEPMTSLNPILSIEHQVGESLKVHLGLKGKPLKEKVAELLTLVGIPVKRMQSYPDELSGGQRQRVMIAMSIACAPRLLIADEPTTALDVTVQAQILDLLADLRNKMQMGMLFITHDFGVVSDIADQVVVMFRGKVVEHGKVSDVLQSPKHPYTKALLDCVPDAAGKKILKPIDYAWLNEGEIQA